MIKYISIVIFALLLVSCGDNNTNNIENQDAENNFVITGKIVGGENKSFYLEALSQQGTIKVSEARSDANGTFNMTGNIPGYGLYQLRMGETEEYIIPLTIVPGDSVHLKANSSTYNTAPNLSGTSWAKSMSRYMAMYGKFNEEQLKLMELKDSLSTEELTKRFFVLKKEVDQFAINEMKKDPSNAFNIVFQSAALPNAGFNEWDPNNLDVLKKVAAALDEKFPNSPVSSTMSNQVYQIELAYQEHIANSSGSRPAPEIALNKPDGTELRLSSLRGKYVLIDFWASWCMPCRQENPNVLRLYKKYKNKGFTVLSVSLDDNKDAWVAAIAKDGLEWPNHVSDLLKWNSPLPQLYGFNGIPHTVLINPEGNIIGVGLRGASLEQKLNELFTKK